MNDELSIYDEAPDPMLFTLDHRINVTHPERPEDIEEALANEIASRLRLQKIISAVWCQVSYGYDDEALEILEREFPPV